MMHNGYGMGAGWTLLVFAFALPGILIAAGLFVAWLQRATATPVSFDAVPGAERVLADRLARGEIGGEEYAERLRALRAERR
jgi:putative membrane protein